MDFQKYFELNKKSNVIIHSIINQIYYRNFSLTDVCKIDVLFLSLLIPKYSTIKNFRKLLNKMKIKYEYINEEFYIDKKYIIYILKNYTKDDFFEYLLSLMDNTYNTEKEIFLNIIENSRNYYQ